VDFLNEPMNKNYFVCPLAASLPLWQTKKPIIAPGAQVLGFSLQGTLRKINLLPTPCAGVFPIELV
jgi:hypothetical protein